MLVVDLSSNNEEPNWDTLRRNGIEGVWLKATEGLTWNDPRFQVWRSRATKAGLRVGAYHFARPDLHPFEQLAEARHFASIVKKINWYDLRPVLDYERTSSHGNDASWIRSWDSVVKDRLGVGPLFYSYPALIEGLKLKAPVGYGLWLASYDRNDGKEHPFSVPAPWKKAVAHQFSSQCKVAGCPGLVDLSKVVNTNAVLAHPVGGRLTNPTKPTRL